MILKKTLLVLSMTSILAGCAALDLIKPAKPPTPPPKPDVSTYERVNGDVCFVREDASTFFIYVDSLENIIEDL